MRTVRERLISWLLVLAMVIGLNNTVLLGNAQAADLPNVVTAALAGEFQSELGAAGDWDPASQVTEMTYYDNGVYEFAANLPAGSYQYKVALNDSWATSYPNDNIQITVPEGGSRVIFRYNSYANTVVDSLRNSSEFESAAVVGSIRTVDNGEIGWIPENTVSEMQYIGGGLYKFSATLEAGIYEYKVALNDTWDVSYPSSNKQITVNQPTSVTFYYNHYTHSVRDSINDPLNTAALVGNLQTELGAAGDWDPSSPVTEMYDINEDGIFFFQGFIPEGSYEYKVALNDNWSVSYPGSNKAIIVPTGGKTVVFAYDAGSNMVTDSINDAATAIQRYIQFKFVRADANYTDYNIWVWGTGKADGQFNFSEFRDGAAYAKIPVGETNNSIGFVVRRGTGWDQKDFNGDRYIDTTGQTVTKVTAYSGQGEFNTVPRASAPIVLNGKATFFYRDEALYQQNQMDTLAQNGNGVKLKFNGTEYDMQYVPGEERFAYAIQNLETGVYQYSFIVMKDGVTNEIPDPMNNVDGVSSITYTKPTANISASVSPGSIDYNDNALLTVNATVSEGNIQAIYADLTALGGNSNAMIDTQLNAMTISVADTVTAGTKQIPITLVDSFGNTYSSTATVDVKARVSSGELDFDWDEARIYFMLTDRFSNGDMTNDNPGGEVYSSTDPGAYKGGDFRGIINRLDYLDQLGINTIWITPIVDNIDYDTRSGEDISFYAYHGYWAKDFTQLDEHLGDMAAFKELIEKAHDKGIKIMVDVVLNHAGYGLKASDASYGAGISNYPTDVDRARFAGMLRDGGTDLVKGELSGLPDFITEDPAVRQKLIEWQTGWISQARTARGDTIDYFRIDTVKHVEDTTWKAFKNSIASIDPDNKMIGEWFGAGVNNTAGQLGTGQMDSLLDFEFNETAANFVNGNIDGSEAYLEDRNDRINNTATLGQFLSSHDEQGFLSVILGGDRGKMKVAAALQITAKGQPVIYYGEEIGLSGANNYPLYDNRPVMPWSQIDAKDPQMMDLYTHYQKLLTIRGNYSKVFSKGDRTFVQGGSSDGYIVFKQSYEGKDVYVALNTTTSAKNVSLAVPVPSGSTYKDEYSGTNYTVSAGKVNFVLPGRNEGGTAILTTNAEPSTEPPAVQDGFIRIHYNRTNNDYDGLGLWIWGDVATPSGDVGGWPSGATPFVSSQRDSYGAYLDIPLRDAAQQIGFLVVDRNTGNKDGGDKSFTIASPEMNEIWIQQGSDQVYKFQPVQLPANTIRIHYIRNNGDYTGLGLWIWNDVLVPSGDLGSWPTAATPFLPSQVDRFGAYLDIPLRDAAQQIGFLVVNRNDGSKDGGDKSFSLLDRYNQVWIREGDNNVYISPYWETAVGLVSAEVVSDSKIVLGFTLTNGLNADALKGAISINDKNGSPVAIDGVSITGNTSVEVTAALNLDNMPFTVSYAGRTVSAVAGWRLLDSMYYYDGNDLGATYHQGNATLKLWAPKATAVVANFYDKQDSTKLIGSIPLVKGDKGVWSLEATAASLGVADLEGYFYQYDVTNDGVTRKVLDPYAKSLAIFRVDTYGNAGPDGDRVGKAAIVNLEKTEPADFDSANIKGYVNREDAIIYEAHIRDFTSDPSVEGSLNARWGSYKAFIDKLDYIKSLGVTHIQLLPIMAWYYGDEAAMGVRENGYSAQGNNYNWGYDPQNYFSPDGAYSENPADPELRVKELKELIDAIHDKGMGVILDVVYTHMANASYLNDIVPNYYAFQNANGDFLGGFGNNLATSHKMAEKLMVDSVKYWFEEYKIDGMRWDMMGDATRDAVQKAYDEAAAINPQALFLGEGWRTFAGHLSDPALAGEGADQDWMGETNGVSVFSDEIRNELKSGYGMEGEPRFVTGGARDIQVIFNSIKGQPGNVAEDDPGDIVQYVESHDNLTLYDVIAKSIRKDPAKPENNLEIHQRVRLANALIMTSQGTAFMQAGQEYGRTKQWLGEGVPEQKYQAFTDSSGNIFGYFISDSNDSSDAINRFDWAKATNAALYPVNDVTKRYTQGLISLRKSTNAFRLASQDLVNSNVTLMAAPEIAPSDLVIAYKCVSTDETGTYYVFVNADNKSRTLTLSEDLTGGKVLVDNDEAGTKPVSVKSGFDLKAGSITLDPLTTIIVRTMPAPTPIKNSDGSVTITFYEPDTTSKPGNASVTVSSELLESAVALAQADSKGVKTIILNIKSGDSKGVSATVPETALRDSKLKIKVTSGVGSLALPSNMLKGLYYGKGKGAAADVTINMAMADTSKLNWLERKIVGDRPVVQITLGQFGKFINWNNVHDPIIATIPYTLRKGDYPKLVPVWTMDSKGKLMPLLGRYDASTGLTFAVPHIK